MPAIKNLPPNVCPWCRTEGYYFMCTRCGRLWSGDTERDLREEAEIQKKLEELHALEKS